MTVNAGLAGVDDEAAVGPNERDFLAAVLRHVALAHAPERDSDELTRLDTMLASDRSEQCDDRRKHRRVAVDLPAAARSGDTQVPARVLDLGAGGLRLRNDGRLPLALGDRMVVSLLPEHAPCRIDVPCEVVAKIGREELGLRFCGAPLVLRGRPAATGGGRHGTAPMRSAA